MSAMPFIVLFFISQKKERKKERGKKIKYKKHILGDLLRIALSSASTSGSSLFSGGGGDDADGIFFLPATDLSFVVPPWCRTPSPLGVIFSGLSYFCRSTAIACLSSGANFVVLIFWKRPSSSPPLISLSLRAALASIASTVCW